jgi:ElaB/YqjD/DUF883 family membrane-anchored ribosome-binding protein
MSYPMNEFVTDLARSAKTAREWLPSPANVVETACHEAGHELSSVMERGRNIYKAVRKRVGKEAGAANAVMHNHPYSSALVGIGAGALLGYFVACSFSRRSG